MKRKFFSALLLMTLSVASVGMFVSCKDYDDDINGVRDDVTNLRNELETTKSDLQTQLSQVQGDFAAQIQAAVAGKADQSVVDDLQTQLNGAVANLQAQIDAANKAIENLNAGEIADAQAALAALTGRVDNVEDAVSAVQKNLEIQQAALASLYQSLQDSGFENLDALLNAITNAQSAISSIQTTVANQGGSIDELKKSMEEAESALKALDEQVNGLAGQIDALKVYIEKMLSSLVFAPDFYYGGIEAMEATTINYKPVLLDNNSTASNPLTTGETWKDATTDNSLTPDITASYHMNPSYFDVNKITSMTVVSGDKDYIQVGDTRSAASAPSVVKDSWKELSKDGMLNVKLNLDASKLATSADKVTVLAVQAHFNTNGVDTTVTSDYAAIAQSTIKDVVIADTTFDNDASCTYNKAFHVYKYAVDAINNDATHELVYDDKTGVDLLKLVQAHFKRNTNETESGMDDVAKYGMKWQFALSHYKSGSNNTSESAHATLNGTNIVACTVDANGNSQAGVQDKSSIDRMPMVRVTLVDTTKTANNIVAVGFIKFKIVEKKAEETNPEPIDINFNDKGTTLSCTDYRFTQTWAQVEALVLSRLDMSKANFEANYSVEKVSGNTCQLYAKTDKGDRVTSNQYGTVTELVNTEDHETTVLQWDVKANDIYTYVWDAAKAAYKTGQSITTGVRFVSNNPKVNPDVYVWFNTGEINVPTASWSDTNKISNNWASKNGTMGSGYAEIHNNVEVVDQVNANDEFNNDILATLVGNEVDVTVANGFADFASSKLTYHFSFVIGDYKTLKGQSGTVYTMGVADNGQTLTATANGSTEAVAKLSTAAGDVTSKQGINSVVSYQQTPYALDILNAASHTDLANTATATVGIYAENTCGMQLPIANNVFDIKFLRPLDATGADGKTFTDAVDGGNKANMIDLVKFIDWRDQWKENYISYYGVDKIEAATADITTTLNNGTLGTTKLSAVTDAVKFEYYATGATKTYGGVDFGYLLYENNGQVTSQFQIRVPLTIYYDWGEITKAYVDITINPTIQNMSVRR